MSISLRRALAGGIRAERARLGITQEEFGRRIGRAKQTVSQIEAGDQSLTAEDLPDVCRALGVTLSDLLARADAEDREALGLP